ncbi:MAG: hypothetical protein ACPIOQ_70345, partial [Promethearchaeia archaeon]
MAISRMGAHHWGAVRAAAARGACRRRAEQGRGSGSDSAGMNDRAAINIHRHERRKGRGSANECGGECDANQHCVLLFS